MEKRLPGKVRRALRAKYHDLEPRAWVGKRGLDDNVLGEIRNQLERSGVLKVEIRKGALISTGMDRKAIAEKVAKLTDSELIDVRGKRFILFKPREGWERYLRRLERKGRAERPQPRKVGLEIKKFRKKFRRGRD